MTPALKAMVEAMERELGRQARESVDMPWVGELEGGEIVIDGRVDLEKVARAGLEAIRRPTEEVREGWFSGEDDFADHPVEFALNDARWAAAIDAILTPATGPRDD